MLRSFVSPSLSVLPTLSTVPRSGGGLLRCSIASSSSSLLLSSGSAVVPYPSFRVKQGHTFATKSSLPTMDHKDPFNINGNLTAEERMIRVCKYNLYRQDKLHFF